MDEDSWLWLEQYVKNNYVLEYDGVSDERVIDAARAMYSAGMYNFEIMRAIAQVWNASIDSIGYPYLDDENEFPVGYCETCREDHSLEYE